MPSNITRIATTRLRPAEPSLALPAALAHGSRSNQPLLTLPQYIPRGHIVGKYMPRRVASGIAASIRA